MTPNSSIFLANIKSDILEASIGVYFRRQFTTVDLNEQVGDVTDTASREPACAPGDSRKVYRVSGMPADHVDLFEAEIDRLARGEGYSEEP